MEAIHRDTSLSVYERQEKAQAVYAVYTAPRRRPISRGWKIAIGCIVAGYALYWLGGAASYNYTHKCVRSYTFDQGAPPSGNEPNGEAAIIVCEYTQDNGRRWGILTPLTSLAHHPARMDGDDGSDGGP